MDDGAFEASQVRLRPTTPEVLRTPWLCMIRSDKPVVCLEDADADREHQLLLESQMVIAESLSLMEQHVDQHAILRSMGDGPMASSAGAVVALPVDLATSATTPLDDVTTGIAGDASAPQIPLRRTLVIPARRVETWVISTLLSLPPRAHQLSHLTTALLVPLVTTSLPAV